MDVADWLRHLNLEQYEPAFRDNDITSDVLARLTANDLKELGVISVGHRRRLLEAIAALQAASVADDTTAASYERTARPAERRRISVMFCDLAHSTALATRLDPEDLNAVIRGYQACAAASIDAYGGFISQYLGDGVMAFFGWPKAGERDAEHAVRAALAIIDGITAAPVHGEQLNVRIGIATGLVVVGEPIGFGLSQQLAAVGETPNLAARLQSVAGPDDIVIDGATRRHLGALFDYRELGSLDLKGFPEPVRAWQVIGPRSVDSHFEALHAVEMAPLIGRDAELALLEQYWRRAASGQGQAVVLSGEPGIGKSRLIAALEHRLADQQPVKLRYFCSPDQTDTALYPVIVALQREAGFADGDTDVQRFDKLRAALVPLTHDPADVALLADMLLIAGSARHPVLDTSPQARKEATFAALIARIRALGAHRSLLIILEDAHWADASSIEFFGRLIPALADRSALLLISTRSADTLARLGAGGAHALPLPHLNQQHAAALATRISTAAALSPALIDRIVAQSDGIPLFVEELTKSIAETAAETGADTATLAVPASLQSSLMARLDRIPLAKEVAQVGAVFGRDFHYSVLSAVAELPELALQRGLQELVDAGLANRDSMQPQANYTFKHALVRDTAYSMLLRSRRRNLHAAAATALADQSPDIRDRQPELLAYHYTQARLAEPAIAYWTRAARRAVARSALVEAVGQLRQALELVPDLPEGPARLRQELELQSSYGGAMFALQAWSGGLASRAFTRALEVAEALDDVEAVARVLGGMVTYQIGQCLYAEAHQTSIRLLRIAERSASPTVQLIAHRCMAVSLHWTGDFAGALHHFDRVIALYEPARDRPLAAILGFDLQVQAAFLSCWDLLLLGRPAEAAVRFALYRAQLQEVTHQHSRVLAFGYGAVFSLLLLDWTLALQQVTDAIALSAEQGFAPWTGISRLLLGSIVAETEDGARGLAEIRAGYDHYTQATAAPHSATGLVLNATYYLGLMANACEKAGHAEDAQTYRDAAIAAAAQCGEGWYEPELHRLRGDWLLRHTTHRPAEAEASFQRAIDQARRQGAAFWELRASISLARHYAATGRRDQAAVLLSPVIGIFKDGYPLAELDQARAILAA